MKISDNEIQINLPTVYHDEILRPGDEAPDEYIKHHDFIQALRDSLAVELDEHRQANDPSQLAHTLINSLNITFPDNSPEYESIERDGFSPTHGHYTESDGAAVSFHPRIHVEVIDPVPFLAEGYDIGLLTASLEYALEDMDLTLDFADNERVTITAADELKNVFASDNAARQQSLDNGVVLVPEGWDEQANPVIRVDDLLLDYPLDNIEGHLSVYTVGGGHTSLPVLSDAMHKQMQSIEAETGFNPVPDGMQATPVANFKAALYGRVLAVCPSHAHQPTDLLPNTRPEEGNRRAERNFVNRLTDFVKRYEHVNGISEAVSGHLDTLSSSPREKARWLQQVVSNSDIDASLANKATYDALRSSIQSYHEAQQPSSPDGPKLT